MNEIKILAAEDAENYRTLRLEALKNNPEAFSSSYEEESVLPISAFEKRLHSSDSYIFGAFSDTRLVGTVTLVIESKRKLQHCGTIYAMYVSVESRQNGIGKTLMVNALEKARQLKTIEQVYLTVVTENYKAKRLYKALGFQVYALERKALKIAHTYYDEEHMVCFFT